MCDDGSTDRTVPLCEQALAEAAHVTGEVVRGAHGGKSEALNIALGAVDTEIVIRHDTDCLLDENAIRYTVPWFVHRPDVGLVGAFMLPKTPLRTWIDRMRAIELVTGFGLPRVGFAVVDSQPCVPGNYTAFRREPAVAIGGWVSGMFGEDIDFTCNLARLGYRAVYDRRVWAYEDVPDTIFQLRTQRRRWNRGSLQNFARFVPPAAGLAGPRFWFAEFLRAARRLIMPLQFIGFIYLLANVLINATPGLNLGRLLAFYVIAKLPLFGLTVLSLNYRRLGRVAWWYPMYLFFGFLKRFANLECMLSMPARAVQLPGRIRVNAPVETTRWPGLRPTALYDE
jgi:cellulose synthase/poly-beta-1,6-N-acetylglucosamine synthase-like glycosyltransferase